MPKKKIKDPEILDSAIQEVIQRYKKRIQERGLSFEVPYVRFKELVLGPCSYCGASAEESMKTTYMNTWEYCRNTIDRVDSLKGYTPDNVVTACLKCNIDKSDLNVIEWLQWIHKIAENTKDYPGLSEAPPLNHRKFTGKLQLSESKKHYCRHLAYQAGQHSTKRL